MRKRLAWRNQTPEQHEISTHKRRSKWNTHPHTADNITKGQVWDARRRKLDETEYIHRSGVEQQCRNKIVL